MRGGDGAIAFAPHARSYARRRAKRRRKDVFARWFVLSVGVDVRATEGDGDSGSGSGWRRVRRDLGGDRGCRMGRGSVNAGLQSMFVWVSSRPAGRKLDECEGGPRCRRTGV